MAVLPKKGLIFCLPGIGDALMATPMIRLLKTKLPQTELHLFCMFPAVATLFKNNPFIQETWCAEMYKNRNSFRVLERLMGLRRQRFDFSILAFPSFRREYHWIERWIGAPIRISHRFQKGYLSECHFLSTDLIPVDESLHNVQNNLNLLEPLGIEWKGMLKPESLRYDFILDPEAERFGKDYVGALGWGDRRVIAFHPGSTISPAALLKRWPIQRFAELSDRLIEKKDSRVLVFVGPEERELGKEFMEKVRFPQRCHLIDQMSFEKALGVLSQVDLLVTNDNGFGHLAVALNKKTVSLLAPTNERWSLPYDADLVSCVRPESFSPWHRYEFKRGIPRGVQSGMDLISVERVFEEVVLQA